MDHELTAYSAILLPLAALILKAALVMGSPGPATMSAAAAGAAFGFARSLAYVSGLILGTVAVLLLVAAGILALLLSVPMLGSVLEVLSSLYIVYLAYRIATAPPIKTYETSAARPSTVAGFVLAMANPKAYVAIAAVYAGTGFPGLSPHAGTLLALATLIVMIVAIHLLWLVLGGALSRLFRDPVAARRLNRIFAAVLLASALMPFL